MGWFDALAGALFSGSNTGSLINSAINVGGRLLSSSEQQSANDEAARLRAAGLTQAGQTMYDAYGNALPQYVAGQRAGVDVYNQAAGTATDLVNRAATTASDMYAPYAGAGAPALAYYQQTLGANPYMLTPQQMIEYEDAQRRQAQALGAGGLRGSGRAVAAAASDLQNRTRAAMTESNRTNQRDAANRLLGVGTQATGAQANLATAAGRYAADTEQQRGRYAAGAEEAIGGRTADTTVQQGRAKSAAEEGSSTVGAQAGLANADIRANTIGGVAGTIGNQLQVASNQAARPYYNDQTGRSTGGTGFGTRDASGNELYGPGFKRGGKVRRRGYASGGAVRAAGQMPTGRDPYDGNVVVPRDTWSDDPRAPRSGGLRSIPAIPETQREQNIQEFMGERERANQRTAFPDDMARGGRVQRHPAIPPEAQRFFDVLKRRRTGTR